MSNPIDRTFHVSRISRAASRTLENVRKHQEHRIEKARLSEEKYKTDLQACKTEMLAMELLPQAEAIIAKKPNIAERGYFVTHRHIGHLLPQDLKWTVMGVSVINSILISIPTIAPYFPKWEKDIEEHLAEMVVNEAAKRERQREYEADNNTQFEIVCDEIVRLLKSQDWIVRNYGKLFNYLRNGLPQYFRGARGVKIIHAAMMSKLDAAGSEHWKTWMDADLVKAEARDAQHRELRRKRKLEVGTHRDVYAEADTSSYMDVETETSQDSMPDTK